MTSESRTDAGQVVAVVRRIEAPRELVFSYLTDPARFVLWMGIRAELDPRPGGAFRVTVGPDAVASGTYEVIEPPARLVFSWGWVGDPEVPPGSSTVEVLLTDVAGATRLELRHSGLPHEASRLLHTAGWDKYVAQLQAAIGARRGS